MIGRAVIVLAGVGEAEMANHPQLWAGLECTVNRVGDRFQDQVRATGHHERTDDIDRLASIG